MCPHNHHHVRVAGEGRCVTPVPWRRRMADLHNVEGMLRCRYEPDRPICCLVDQDDASSPDQAGDQVIGLRERTIRIHNPFSSNETVTA